MKVLFDHQIFTSQRFGGISRYFANVHNGLNTTQGINSKIAALYSENEYLPQGILPMDNAVGKKFFHKHQNRLRRWNQRYSEWCISKNRFDVFHPTYYDTYFIDKIKKPFVLTVHDMIHELMPHHFTDSAEIVARKKLLISKASAIIAISYHTKNDIIRFYPEAEGKISVVHHGYYVNPAVVASNKQLPLKYILYVGDRGKYKNFVPFIKSVKDILLKDDALQIICTGGGSFLDDEQYLLSDLGLTGRCIQINATENDLAQLYQQAAIFVFPSEQEGFGFPILEAFANGCPVLCCNASSLPEVAGDAAMYFNVEDVASISTAVEKVLNDAALRADMVSKGKKQLESFTIGRCVADTLKVYESLVFV